MRENVNQSLQESIRSISGMWRGLYSGDILKTPQNYQSSQNEIEEVKLQLTHNLGMSTILFSVPDLDVGGPD